MCGAGRRPARAGIVAPGQPPNRIRRFSGRFTPHSGVWWVKWVALGMGIATLVALARGARTLLVLALAGWVGVKIYQRYGAAARSQFDAWVARTNPGAAQMLQAWSASPAATGGFDGNAPSRPH